jgi:DNA-binding NtrC family response regulator
MRTTAIAVRIARPFRSLRRALIDEFERRYLCEVFEQQAFDISRVMRTTGLSRRHLEMLIDKHRLDEDLALAQMRSRRDRPGE